MLRTVADLRRLTTAARHARTAVVVGSGFIGCEAAASLAIRGLQVTLVSPEAGPQQKRVGDHPARTIADWLTSLGVQLRLEVEVSSVQAPRRVHLHDGTTIEPDLLLLALGSTPSTAFLEGSGVDQKDGRIVVDHRLETSTSGVFAVGEVAGRNAAGAAKVWNTVPGFWSEIGEHTLMYAAWGDGWDSLEVVEDGTAFTIWYSQNGVLVGVLAHENEDDYERGRALIADHARFDAVVSAV